MKGAHVTLRNLGMGIASSLIAAGIALGITEPKHWVSAVVITAAGVAAFVVTYLVTKKPSPPSQPIAPPPVSVHQENKQEFNPQFNPQFNPSIQIGVTRSTEEEHRRIELLVMEVLKQYRKPDRSLPQPLSVIVEGSRRSDPQFTELDIVEALNRLCSKGVAIRKPLETEGGYVYWLL